MPAGPSPVGFAYFVAAKFIGYSLFCRFAIQRKVASPALKAPASLASFSEPDDLVLPPIWIAGGIRTLIGIAIGAAVGLAFWRIPYFANHDNADNILFFSLLIPVRIGEWWLLLRWIYKDFPLAIKDRNILIAMGIVTSFVLDAIGLVSAFVLPGGIWVC